ncbi:SpoIIE family protein phosphatase [Kineococcus sp. TRM81007]|uniref:SpoIIE family protein phosphatase n=1 Tax=Kineococcus sp. TRM81007 TaxID=2925831 RepID=UPI0027E29ADC|nr:SpoIIE family protein phosphatase [Kineococcus sp. TRM81007]
MISRRREHQTLLEVTTLSLRHGQDLRAILHAATVAATDVTGAEYGAFFYHDRDEHGDRLDLLTLAGAAAEDFPTAEPVRNTPLFAPTFTGAAVVRIDDVLTDPRFGRGGRRGMPADHPPMRSYLAVPVTSTDGRVLGALLFGHREPGRFDEDAEAAATAAARGAGIAIENALLVGEQRTARELAEDREAAAAAAAARTELLQSITALLSTSATTADITASVPRAVVEATDCAAAALYLVDPVRGILTGNGHPPLPPELTALRTVALGADDPLADAIRTGTPVVLTGAGARRPAGPPEQLPWTAVSTLAVPLVERNGRSLGVLVVERDDAEPTDVEVSLFTSVAAQVALALERAQLLDAERAARENLAVSVSALTELARTLQRGLLPQRLPVLERVAVAVRYQPAVVGAEVGGDWYDAVALDDDVVFVIGDVQGHNTTAAGLMGQLRTAVRAYVTEGHGPGAALERTNRLLAEMAEELFATCCLVRLDQGSGTVTVATAGHPAPLVVDGAGLRELDVEPGPPLGVDPEAAYPTATHRLRRRSRVVLYTDGVVESRAEQLDQGLESLRRTVAAHAGASCEELASRIMASIPHRLDDDAAMLVLEYAGPSAQLEEAALPLPADVRAVAQSRAFLRTALDAWDAAELLDEAELVLSELVTNALVHTDSATGVLLRYDRAARRLTISVQDRSTRHPRERHADPDALGGRGLGIVEAVADDWGVSLEGEGKTVWAELAIETP